jgi:DNA-binding transcriptional LysR family regulator
MRINCEIHDLKAFLAVLDARQLPPCGDSAHMTQPTVSRRVGRSKAVSGDAV